MLAYFLEIVNVQGVMAKRVMNLLWSIMMDPEAPLEVSKSPAITDALQAYAYRKGKVDNQIIYEYMHQCVTQIQAGISVLPAMNLLHRLVFASVSPPTTPFPCAHLLEIVLVLN